MPDRGAVNVMRLKSFIIFAVLACCVFGQSGAM
jgi:hypothetical protein